MSENFFESTTTVLELLERGWKLTSPDYSFVIDPDPEQETFDVRYIKGWKSGTWYRDYELSAEGLNRAISEVIDEPGN